jgi:hypothetical protein
MKKRCATDCERPVTEIEMLRRRRELVLLSAKLQRVTVMRRLDRVNRHPLQAVLGLAASAASVPLAFKLGSMVVGRIARRHEVRNSARRGRASVTSAFLGAMRFLPVLKMFPAMKFLNR